MASGAVDANGVWQYGEDDSVSPFSGFMNLLAATASTAIGLLRGRVAALETLTADTGWITATLGNSWTSYDGGTAFPVPQYRLRQGDVVLNGAMKTGTTAATAFTLPVGSRPLKNLDFFQSANAGAAQVRVLNTGAVQVLGYYAGGTSAIVSLAGIRFVAEQ